jgi:crotonobetainyl-CoA:carnitine CoA-transferase CaiB-like acyl-CoA transferase
MDHHGANVMAVAILAALVHRRRTGEGQWVDMACTEAGAWLNGLAMLDAGVNDRPQRRPGQPDSNRGRWPLMVPHGIYPAAGDDRWVAIACRDDADWVALTEVVDEPWTCGDQYESVAGRVAAEADVDRHLAEWTSARDATDVAARLQSASVPAAIVATPEDRIEHDVGTSEWGLWPEVTHSEIGRVRVDGIPIHLSATDWSIRRGAPCLGEHNDMVFREILGLSDDEVAALREEGSI